MHELVLVLPELYEYMLCLACNFIRLGMFLRCCYDEELSVIRIVLDLLPQ
jgi:hypothetical protein